MCFCLNTVILYKIYIIKSSFYLFFLIKIGYIAIYTNKKPVFRGADTQACQPLVIDPATVKLCLRQSILFNL